MKIDRLLKDSGWVIQNYRDLDLSVDAVAVREFPLKHGHGKADYVLYLYRKAVGIVEAKKVGVTLTGIEVQTEKYSVGLPISFPAVRLPLPFLYLSTGDETRFTNNLDRDPASRDIFSFHRPETLANWLNLDTKGDTYQKGNLAAEPTTNFRQDGTLLQRLRSYMPDLITDGMRPPQITAVTKLEESLAKDRRRSLIQMQTGSGKTYTAVASCYRLIKFGKAKRIVFLVDRSNLARQTLKEFQNYETPDDGRKFTELYNVQHLTSNKIDPVAKVVITTIQRLYSILRGEEEFDPSAEEESYATTGLASLQKTIPPIEYNPNIPIEFFDFVWTDECHRSIYNLWRQVLEYFDAYLIGLTATPSKQTLGYFQRNLVMEYGHREAVIDKVNVDFDVYKIVTRITQQGSTVDKGYFVDIRDRKTRRQRWQELDQDLTYSPNQLDRAVVAEDQIRTIIRTFRDQLPIDIFPGRTEVPKTLIFAKDDSHAEDIVRIIREEFGKGNEFCEKITYRTSTARVVTKRVDDDGNESEVVTYKGTGIKPEDLLSSFRNSYNPRIAVTVDMIATGTDVKALEIVFFMRDVQSANYFEQMKGRGCRVISPEDLKGVTPDATGKTRYVIIDAVGVTEHCKSDSPPLDRQPNVPTQDILKAVAAGNIDPEVLGTLAGRLARIERLLTPAQIAGIEEVAGQSFAELTKNLADAADLDAVQARACELAGLEPDSDTEPPADTILKAQTELAEKAARPFLNPRLREAILNAQADTEQTIDRISQDQVLEAGASQIAKEKAQSTITSFVAYLQEHKDELTAIELLYSRRKGLAPTLADLKKLAAEIERPPRNWTPEAIWRAYETLESSKVKGHGGQAVTDLVSLVRFALEQETLLSPFSETVNDRFVRWMTEQKASGANFTEEQVAWLEMLRDNIATSMTVEKEDLDNVPFNQRGGLGKAFHLFGARLDSLLAELTEALAA